MRAWILRKPVEGTRREGNNADAPDWYIFTKRDLTRNAAVLYLTEDAADRALLQTRYTGGYQKVEIDIPD